MTRRHPILLGGLTAVLAVASLVGTAEAGRGGGGGHVGGGAHFSGGGGAHFSAHYSAGIHVGGYAGGYGYRGGYGVSRAWARPGWGYRGYGWGVGGRAWVGGYPWWGWGYPYGYGYGYEYGVPSYYPYGYGQSYYPVQPGVYAGPSAAVIVAPHPQLPRFGIGGYYGGSFSNDYNSGSTAGASTSETDYGLVARFRLTPGLIVEGELGQISTSVQQQGGQTVNNARVDRRLGGTLIYEIGAYNRLAPYVLGGLGVEQSQVDGNYSTTSDYAELGIGLRLAITPHFHLAFDVRAGELQAISNDSSSMAPPNGTIASTVTPPSSSSSNNSEDYTRARLTAILYF